MPEADLDRALVDVANAVGADVSYVAPSDERHFDSAAILYAFAEALLSGFFSGMIDEAGSMTAHRIGDVIKRLFSKPEDEQKKELERQTAQLKELVNRLETAETRLRLERCEHMLAQALGTSFNFPTAVAQEKAARVKKIVFVEFVQQ